MTINAIAAVAHSPSQPWQIEPVAIDDPRDDEVIVRIAGTGLCHTDLVFASSMKIMKAPAIFGHEGAGIVEKVGSAVTMVAPGDHVVLTFNSCGQCSRCTSGHPAYCQFHPQHNYIGCRPDGSRAVHVGDRETSAHFFGQSSFATYALASERNVVKVDKDVPIELLGPLGCGVQTGAGSVMRAMACGEGSSLVIFGGGSVGLSAVMGAVIQKCATIIVVEPVAARREMASALGATHTIDPGAGDVTAAVKQIMPTGVDYAFDTSGRVEVVTAGIGCLASSGTIGLVGVAPLDNDNLPVSINQLIGTGLRVMGIIEGDVVPDEFIPTMVGLYKEGRFPFDRLITTYPLVEINRAVTDQHEGKCIKPVLIP
ncbi:NAD(P)-dependent alcohol dehydrogenase [Novosphingobium sp. HII-3]|uniref:NAD(P)-dependent alcohol dehydrogenase n=1 Tax=Novosphingobium sp. HII-3 TaxID=2075565 RepID=UPI0018EAF4D1|nr:NAD(P)-dependent alcohol dehydrogenase [Novosphingobium sp. HII-3]